MRDELVHLEDYQTKLCEIARDKSKFAKVTGIITEKACMEGLSLDFSIRHELPHLFFTKPTL